MTNYKNILVFIETKNGNIDSISYELIAAGRKLADGINQELAVLVLDAGLDNSSFDELFKRGVDIIYKGRGLSLSGDNHAYNISLLEKSVQKINPQVFLLESSDLRNTYATVVAESLNSAVLTNCNDLSVTEEKQPIFSRAVYCGKAIASYEISSYPNIVTIKPKSFAAAELTGGGSGRIEEFELALAIPDTKMKLVEQTVEEDDMQLESAKVVVCAGGGIGGKEGLAQLHKLAESLNGVVGATKIPCDEGWVPQKTYIGQTGKTISPDLYLAIGVSGATQHITGVLGSKRIIAINRDKDAPIFKYSDFGIVADYREILPIVLETLNEIK